jgi:hypothetical protein
MIEWMRAWVKIEPYCPAANRPREARKICCPAGKQIVGAMTWLANAQK